jgi:hypothetical protein
MIPVSLSKSLTAPSANCIAQGQSVAAGANAIINGTSSVSLPLGPFGAMVTVGTFDTQRRVAIVSSADDSANTAHLYGLRQGGQPINEILALKNAGTAVSVLDYQTLTTIEFASATAGTITVGNNVTGSTDWIVPNYDLTPFSLTGVIEVTGTVTYAVESTNTPKFFDPPKNDGYATTPQPSVGTIVAPGSIGASFTLAAPVTGFRYTISVGTGTVAAQSTQAGITNM